MRHSLGIFVAVMLSGGCVQETPACTETRRVVGYEEMMASGDSPRGLMEAMGGEVSGTLTWRGGGDAVVVDPASGSTQVTIALAYDGGEVAVIERRRPDELDAHERLACSDDVVIAATLHIETSDGAIRGAWPVEAVHAVGGGALEVSLRPFAPGTGDLSATLVRPQDWDASELRLLAVLEPGGVWGDVTLGASRELPDDGNKQEGAGLDVVLAGWTIARP